MKEGPADEAPSLLTEWEGRATAEWAERWGVPVLEIHEAIGSTNDRARALAANGVAPFAVVMAERQTAGRGRGGSAWHDRPGASISMSVVLAAGATVPWMPLLVGLAVARAIEVRAPGLTPLIEWPNDVMVDGRKVAGVLCEREGAYVVAGVGVNVAHQEEHLPEDLAGRAGSLAMAGAGSVSRPALAGSVLRELRALVEETGGRIPSHVLDELRQRDALLGREVRTSASGEGIARGIDADGALLLERAHGPLTRVLAGSVRAL